MVSALFNYPSIQTGAQRPGWVLRYRHFIPAGDGPVRVATAVQDHARTRNPPVDGLDILAVGKHGDGVVYGNREVEARATRTHSIPSNMSRLYTTARESPRRRATPVTI